MLGQFSYILSTTIMKSITKKSKAVDLRIIQAEASLRRLCKDKHQFEKYIPPCDDERKDQRYVRHRKVRNSVLTEEERLERLEEKKATGQTKGNTKPPKNYRRLKFQNVKEKCSCEGLSCVTRPWTLRGHRDVKCKKSEWTAQPHCKDVDLQQKEKFEVTGRGGSPVYV